MFQPYFSDGNVDTSWHLPYMDWFLGLPLIIRIAIVSIIISVCFIVYVQYRIWYIRYKSYQYQKRVQRIVPKIDDLISEKILMRDAFSNGVQGDTLLDTASFNSPIFHNRKNRQILIDRLISYRKGFTGSTGEQLRRVYIELGLDKVSFKKMKNRHWEIKGRGIRELTDMDIPISDVSILPLTNNKRQELRSEARNAYIKLSKNEPFKFFDINTEPLLKWDQIELFKTITTTENIAIPNFARWVTYSNNQSIVSFCLKLIVYYNQLDAAPAVVKLLDNRDHLLRAEAINCLGKLKYEEVAPRLIHIYSNQPLNCQLEILKALGRIGAVNSVGFLKQEFLYSTDFDIRKNAARSIARMEDTDQIKELMESCTPDNQLILKHSLNPLIKY